MMRKKALEALFKSKKSQPHRLHLIKQDDKPDEEFRVGWVRYGVRVTPDEYRNRFPHLPQNNIPARGMLVITSCSRQHLKLLKRHLFEKFTGAGWPILQTKAWIKLQELIDDTVVTYGAKA